MRRSLVDGRAGEPEPSGDPAGDRSHRPGIAAAVRLAEAEEKIARGQEQRAAQQPDRADQCPQIAKDARASAERARQIARQFTE